MGIKTEINRLNTAKLNIKNALYTNGIVLSDTSKLDEYGELIDVSLDNYKTILDTINGEVV